MEKRNRTQTIFLNPHRVLRKTEGKEILKRILLGIVALLCCLGCSQKDIPKQPLRSGLQGHQIAFGDEHVLVRRSPEAYSPIDDLSAYPLGVGAGIFEVLSLEDDFLVGAISEELNPLECFHSLAIGKKTSTGLDFFIDTKTSIGRGVNASVLIDKFKNLQFVTFQTEGWDTGVYEFSLFEIQRSSEERKRPSIQKKSTLKLQATLGVDPRNQLFVTPTSATERFLYAIPNQIGSKEFRFFVVTSENNQDLKQTQITGWNGGDFHCQSISMDMSQSADRIAIVENFHQEKDVTIGYRVHVANLKDHEVIGSVQHDYKASRNKGLVMPSCIRFIHRDTLALITPEGWAIISLPDMGSDLQVTWPSLKAIPSKWHLDDFCYGFRGIVTDSNRRLQVVFQDSKRVDQVFSLPIASP